MSLSVSLSVSHGSTVSDRLASDMPARRMSWGGAVGSLEGGDGMKLWEVVHLYQRAVIRENHGKTVGKWWFDGI